MSMSGGGSYYIVSLQVDHLSPTHHTHPLFGLLATTMQRILFRAWRGLDVPRLKARHRKVKRCLLGVATPWRRFSNAATGSGIHTALLGPSSLKGPNSWSTLLAKLHRHRRII